MASNILDDIKKVLNIPSDYAAFDSDVIMHINSTFAILHQLGVGPDTTYTIEDDQNTWDELGLSDNQLSLVKSYVYLKTRMLFDPPSTSFTIEAVNKMIQEHEHRLVSSAELSKLADS